MARIRRSPLEIEAHQLNAQAVVRAGREIRKSRRRRGWTQVELGQRSRTSKSAVGRIERGTGAGASLDTWQRIGVALGRPFAWDLRPDAHREPADAGHLAGQELMLRLGRATGYDRTFEGATAPADPSRSIDVRLRDDARRTLLVEEIWNTFGDIGAGARSFDRKIAETQALAVAIGHGQPYRVHGCWVVRATKRNRELVARYPEVFATKFPGSSHGWVQALTRGTDPPEGHGLVWCDVAATRVFAWRRRPSP